MKDRYTDEFESFWKAYPARWNRDLGMGMYVKRKKFPAFQKWQRLSQAIRDECMAKVKYIRDAEGTPRDAVTWLNQRGWEDFELPGKKEKLQPLPRDLTPKMKQVNETVKPVDTSLERSRQLKELKGGGNRTEAK